MDKNSGEEAVRAPQGMIFALDIGTRSIIGIVGKAEGELFHVLAVDQMEHTKRAMIDGQIEDIAQTAKVAGVVKGRLEQKLGCALHDVCVAAAGRTLRTQQADLETALDPKEPISAQQITQAELQAVQKAYEALAAQEGEDAAYYCVGYSVIRYTLDDYPISTLLGHRGKRAKVEIIATFLPNAVVESLYTTMNEIGLSVSSLTLEPIAAMNAIIPQELRLLNLALVDIGAGTSDIAVSSEGSVAAYTMATVAGDEITEAIIKAYLVDFATAEEMKLALGQNRSEVQYRDILGFSYTVPAQEVLEKIAPAVDNLCATVCDRILEVNGRAPAAVFLVGGGSQFPFLCDKVAERLSIERNKVAVGSNNYMKRLVKSEEDVSGPQFATPVGIALTAAAARERENFCVTLNGEEVRLFRTGGMSVMDVLLYRGYKHSQIIGRSGQSVTIDLNGQKKTVRGGLPTAAQITVGGKPAILSTPLRPGDSIEITPAEQGADAAPTLGEVLGSYAPFTVLFEGETFEAGTRAQVNGEPATGPGQVLHNLDSVKAKEIRLLGELCEAAGIDPESCCLTVNGEISGPERELAPGDEVAVVAEPEPPAAVAPVPPPEPAPEGPPVVVTINGGTERLPPRPRGMPYQFVDMLNFVDIDPSKPQGNIVLRLNGRSASYLEPVRDGDRIEIYWESRP